MNDWEQIRGHENIKEYFMNALKYNDIFHAYMLCGEDGCGKGLLAKTFAKALLCDRNQIEPCGECDSCKKADSFSHPDIIYVKHEKTGSISVDEIRQQLIVPMSIKPYYGGYKIFIIDDAELMTTQAQNAVLKTLEEPPKYGIIILLTNNENMMLSTILSRTVSLHCGSVKYAEVMEYLIDNCQVPDYKADFCARYAQGNIGKAIAMATIEDFYSIRDEAVSIAKLIPEIELFDLLSKVKDIVQYKNRISDYLDFFSVWYHDVLMYKATFDVNFCLFPDELSDIMKQSELFSYEALEECLEGIAMAKNRIRANVNFELAMELLLMQIKKSIV